MKIIFRTLIKIMVILVLFLLTVFILNNPFFSVIKNQSRQKVATIIPDEFPILIFSRAKVHNKYTVQFLYQNELEEFIRKNPQSSYLATFQEENLLDREIVLVKKRIVDPLLLIWESPIP